jgi:hypothetical protein
MVRFTLPAIVNVFIVAIQLRKSLFYNDTPERAIRGLFVEQEITIINRNIIVNDYHSGKTSNIELDGLDPCSIKVLSQEEILHSAGLGII